MARFCSHASLSALSPNSPGGNHDCFWQAVDPAREHLVESVSFLVPQLVQCVGSGSSRRVARLTTVQILDPQRLHCVPPPTKKN